MNLAQYLVNTARTFPTKAAVRCEGRAITFRELDIQSNRLANSFRDLGLEPGDHALVMMPNSIDRVVVYFAFAKAGLVEIPVNCTRSFRELQSIVSDAQPKIFIGAEPYLDHIRQVFALERGPSIRLARNVSTESEFINLEAVYSKRPESPLYAVERDETLTILYGEGTDGGAKGVMFSHANLASICEFVRDLRGAIEQETVVIGSLPLYNAYGIISVLGASISLGLTVELLPRFDAERVISLIERERQSLLVAVPVMYERLIELARVRPARRNSLKLAVSRGEALRADNIKRFEDLFETVICEGYGLAEAPLCSLNPCEGGTAKAGSIGRPVPGVTLRVVNGDGEDLSPGHIGELLVRGPVVMKGYLNRPGETANKLKDGWLHTGEAASMDEDGYFYIRDRKGDRLFGYV